jgi:hypothetical protein
MLTGCATVQGDWEKAKKTDTTYAYQGFLREHSGSEYDGQAKKRIEEIAWVEASKQGDINSYRKFIRNYPNSPHYNEAAEKLINLEWESAKKNNSNESYAHFLSAYPSNIHADEARKRLREIKFETVKKNESVAAIEDFLKLYPQGDDSDALRMDLPALRLWEPRKELAERIIGLCPKETLTIQNLLGGTTRTQPSNPKKELEEIRAILESGVDPNAVRIADWAPQREEQGITIIRGNVVPTTQIIMGNPGHPVPADKNGMTLLEYCKTNGLTEAYNLLKSHGAK